MKFGVLYEVVSDAGFPSGYYYAHIPSLGLTTHGQGISGAHAAALDLVQLWLEEKRANGEQTVPTGEVLFSTLELPDDALQSA
jgi:predicted RNase H-like HicB family nuclease